MKGVKGAAAPRSGDEVAAASATAGLGGTPDKCENEDGADADADADADHDGSADDRHPWQEVVVPANRSVRGREWRVVLETCQVLREGRSGASPSELEGSRQREGARKMQVGMEVELREVSRLVFLVSQDSGVGQESGGGLRPAYTWPNTSCRHLLYLSLPHLTGCLSCPVLSCPVA